MVIVIDPACVLRNRNDESRDHLFFFFLWSLQKGVAYYVPEVWFVLNCGMRSFFIKTVIFINNFMKKCYFLKFSIVCYILSEIPF